MAFVVDASVMLDRALGELNPVAARARARLQDEEAVVPALWWFETKNVLIVNERRRRISEADSARALREWSLLDITIDLAPNEVTVLTLARRHRLTVYDAAYLELALRERLDLATLDENLAAAARREGVAVIGDTA
jgi:predicted nucleic acid-binding protein